MDAKLKIAVLYDRWEGEEEPTAEALPPCGERRRKPRTKRRAKPDHEEVFEVLEKLGHKPFYYVLDGRELALRSGRLYDEPANQGEPHPGEQ